MIIEFDLFLSFTIHYCVKWAETEGVQNVFFPFDHKKYAINKLIDFLFLLRESINLFHTLQEILLNLFQGKSTGMKEITEILALMRKTCVSLQIYFTEAFCLKIVAHDLTRVGLHFCSCACWLFAKLKKRNSL